MDTMEDSAVKKSNILMSEGVLLALVPFIGTFVAFIYELTYLKYFDAPIGVMQLDFVKVVAATTAVAFALLLFALVLFGIRNLSSGAHPVRKALGLPLVLTLILGPVIYIGPLEDKAWVVGGFFVLFVGLTLIAPLFGKEKGEKYLDRLSKDNEEATRIEYSDPLYGKFISVISLPLTIVFFVFLVGLYNAKTKEYFFTIPGQGDKVVIEIYGDIMVMKGYDPETKIMSQAVSLVKFDESAPVDLEYKWVGPLLPPETKSNNATKASKTMKHKETD